MLKKLTLTALLAASTLYADTIGGEISLGGYSHTPSGFASYEPGAAVDLEDDLKWSSEQDIVFKAYLEHPLPLLPNTRVAFTSLSHDGQGSVTTFSWGDIIDLDGDIETSLDLKMYDLTLYYELLDNWVEIDTGLTLRYLDGNIAVNPLNPLITDESTNFNSLIPMLYGKARFNIPSTDISLQFEGNVISYEDTTFYDYELSARYTLTMGLGLEGGHKAVHLDSQDLESGLNVDMDFKGPYASLVWDF